MPKKTFMNLPSEKKDKITEIAIDEFAQHTYLDASINRVVENAEIAKGSFYQYFEDKMDLYEYVLEVALVKKRRAITDALKKIHEIDFFEKLREIYLAEIRFITDFPKLSNILTDFEKNYKSDINKSNLENKLSSNLYEDLVNDGISNRDIDINTDVKFTAYLLNSFNIIIREYIITEDKQVSHRQFTDYIDKYIDYLRNGIKIKRRTVKNVEDRFY